jgi:hypothetical protein
MEINPPDPLGTVQTIQRLVYYISEVLHDAKTRYLEVHKMPYAVLIASRKPHHYFQAHRILVVTSYPLKAVLHNPNATENNDKWVAELAEFELDFLPYHAVKSQVLANFMADWTPPSCNPRGWVIASRRSKLRSSRSLTGHSFSMAPRESRVPKRGSYS